MITFDARLAVVAGAGSGIAREIVRLLAKQGMRLALLDINGPGLEETTALIADGAHVSTHRVDVTDASEVTAAAARIIATAGAPTVLVNSVGNLGAHDLKAWEASDAEWRKIIAINLLGPVNTVRAFLPAMHDSAQPGAIVNISSMAGLWPESRAVVYGAAKHALVSFSESLSAQLAGEGSPIDVMSVCPGAVPTNLNRELRATAGHQNQSSWIPAGVVAQQIVDALRAPRPYLFTHPDTRGRLADYHRRLISCFDPDHARDSPQ